MTSYPGYPGSPGSMVFPSYSGVLRFLADETALLFKWEKKSLKSHIFSHNLEGSDWPVTWYKMDFYMLRTPHFSDQKMDTTI